MLLQARAGQSLSNYQELPLVPASPTAGRLSFGLAMQGQALSRTRYYQSSMSYMLSHSAAQFRVAD